MWETTFLAVGYQREAQNLHLFPPQKSREALKLFSFLMAVKHLENTEIGVTP